MVHFYFLEPRGVGKSSLIIDYINLKKEKYLYIDAEDPIFALEDIYIEELEDFIKENSIKILVIDHYFKGFLESLPKIEQLILVSREKIENCKLRSFNLFPLDYEEFLGFKRVPSQVATFNYFLKLGTLPKIANSSTTTYFPKLREIFFDKFDEVDGRLLLIISKFHSRKASTHQIYTTAKDYFRISKDWTYKTVKRFQKEQIIYIFDDIVEKSLKKIVLYDFVLARYLNKNLTFFQIFDSIISLSLIKHRFKFLTLDNSGYLILEKNRLVIPSPFESKEQFKIKIKRLLNSLKEFNIKNVAIVTVSNRYFFKIENIVFEALPFYEWNILNE